MLGIKSLQFLYGRTYLVTSSIRLLGITIKLRGSELFLLRAYMGCVSLECWAERNA